MKVYYEQPALPESDFQDERSELFMKLAHENLENISYKFKYRLMWELRRLEEPINVEGGVIIMKEGGDINTRGFTAELTGKIVEVIRKIKWEPW